MEAAMDGAAARAYEANGLDRNRREVAPRKSVTKREVITC